MTDNTGIMDVAEAARYLKLNDQTIRSLARQKNIPAFKVGGSWRFMKSALHDWAIKQMEAQDQKHILVVDDDPNILTMLRRVLTKTGMKVSTAEDGRQAMEIMHSDTPDAVFLDLVMPGGMNGVDVIIEIRELVGNIPVIIFTGHPYSELMDRAMEHSPIMLLSKPSSSEKIIEAARIAVGEKAEVLKA